jgi:hypothetical protein
MTMATVTQVQAVPSQPDIKSISGSYGLIGAVTFSTESVAINHAPIPMSKDNIDISISGVTTFGTVLKNSSAYTYTRVSATQTIFKKNLAGTATISFYANAAASGVTTTAPTSAPLDGIISINPQTVNKAEIVELNTNTHTLRPLASSYTVENNIYIPTVNNELMLSFPAFPAIRSEEEQILKVTATGVGTMNGNPSWGSIGLSIHYADLSIQTAVVSYTTFGSDIFYTFGVFTGDLSTATCVLELNPSADSTITVTGIEFLPSQTNTTTESPSTIDFVRPAFEDWTLDQYIDKITPNVWITRADSGGLFNIKQEIVGFNGSENGGFDEGWSPAGTEWAYPNNNNGLSCTFANAKNLVFEPWFEAIQINGHGLGNDPLSVIGVKGLVHLIAEDKYFEITITDWSDENEEATGAVSYTRTVPVSLSKVLKDVNFNMPGNPSDTYFKHRVYVFEDRPTSISLLLSGTYASPISYQSIDSLPGSLTLSSSGVLTGMVTPDLGLVYSGDRYRIKVTDRLGNSRTLSLYIEVGAYVGEMISSEGYSASGKVITFATLPPPWSLSPYYVYPIPELTPRIYSQQLEMQTGTAIPDTQFVAQNAVGDVTWSLYCRELPPGITFSSTGLLSGTYTGYSDGFGYVLSISVEDSVGNRFYNKYFLQST